jgi:GNAT superfamily N-acetyltransferase
VLLAKDGSSPLAWPRTRSCGRPPGVSTSLHLKELYVRQSQRRAGIGRLLIDKLIEITKREGCTRVEVDR